MLNRRHFTSCHKYITNVYFIKDLKYYKAVTNNRTSNLEIKIIIQHHLPHPIYIRHPVYDLALQQKLKYFSCRFGGVRVPCIKIMCTTNKQRQSWHNKMNCNLCCNQLKGSRAAALSALMALPSQIYACMCKIYASIDRHVSIMHALFREYTHAI